MVAERKNVSQAPLFVISWKAVDSTQSAKREGMLKRIERRRRQFEWRGSNGLKGIVVDEAARIFDVISSSGTEFPTPDEDIVPSFDRRWIRTKRALCRVL